MRKASQKSSFAWLGFLATLILSLVAIWLFSQNAGTTVPASWGVAAGDRSDVLQVINAVQQILAGPLIMTGLAALILTRQPGNRIGQLLMVLGLVSLLSFLVAEYAVYGAYTVAHPLAGTDLAAWITNWIWIFIFAPLLLMGALFPDGRFLSRRWALLVSALLLWFILPMTFGAMIESPMSSAYQIPNPYFRLESDSLYEALFTIGVFGMPTTAIAVLAAAVMRFRRSAGRERQQIKWLLTGVAALVLSTITGLGLSFGLDSRIGELLVNSAVLWPVFGIGVALLRHRLYDIDILLRRTLVYAILTALLAGAYFAVIVVLQGVFQGLTGSRDSALITVITTLVIAALFNPLRIRIQDAIDRRFYRSRYDAERTIAQFAAAARDEVDMDRLAGELLGVVSATMRPQTVNLWLQEQAEDRNA